MSTTLRERTEHAAKYGSNLIVPAIDIKQLLDQLDAALEDRTGWKKTGASALKKMRRTAVALDAVRQLHTTDVEGNCAHCTRGRLYPVPAPCDTAAALAEGGGDV